jgi:molybdate transport system substrate-binding protein
MRLRVILAAIGAFILSALGPAQAGQTQVAVAANFTAPAKDIAAAFKAKTGDEAVLSFVEAGLAVADSRFTYAIGKLVLWSKSLDVSKGDETLKANAFAKLSIANPKSAPYGAAAVEAMTKLGVYDAIQPKIVQGNSIAQAFEFVDTGNAELGFVALSQLAAVTAGSRWVVPQALYAPIRQDAALLETGADDATSKAFLAFLKGPEARAIIEKYGYSLE